MAPHSSVLAWRIPGMGEPSGLPSMGSHRVEHDWSDLAAAAGRRQWHPTPVLLPGKSQGRRSLEGCNLWVTEGRTRLSYFTFTFHFHALEKEMATHSSVLAWRIPGTGEPGGLPSMASQRVRHDWNDLAAAAAAAAAARRPGVLWFMESQRVRHDWVTELNWTECPNLTFQNSVEATYSVCPSPHQNFFPLC